MPVHIRAEVERILGSRIVAARNSDGGFSPGPAARCDLDDGRVAFVKAAGVALNPISPAMHRREVEVLAVLPRELPAPRLIGVADDGDWVAVATQWIDGPMPTAPLSGTNISRVLRVADRLSDFASVVEGEHVVHFNLRIDNIVLGAVDFADVVDWPNACIGAGCPTVEFGLDVDAGCLRPLSPTAPSPAS